MADNAKLTEGDGTIIAGADEIGGVKYPRVKLIIGADGVNDGDVSLANPLPIVGPVDIQSQAISGTGASNAGGIAPGQAISIGFIDNDDGDKYHNVSTDTPLPVVGSITATNPSVEVIGDPTPLSATVIGFDDGGDTAAVSSGNPLPIVGAVTLGAALPAGTNVIGHVIVDSGAIAVTGNLTNISGTITLPTGASTAAKQPALGTAGTASTDVISVQGIASMTPLLATVTGNLTNISGTITLPTGAATAAKQPALGTAGTASADVITMQGIASMTPILATVTGNLTNIAGTISLPTGASTAAKQPALGTAGTASTDVITMQGIASMTPILATITGNVTTVSTVTTITNDVKVIGDTAADAALTVAPITIGARAANANPANMSAAGDVVNLQADLGGRLVTIDAPRELIGRTNTALSNTTTETTIIAATALTFHDLYGLILANTGATATEVSIRDDTAGTVMLTVMVPAGETRGFMVPASSATPQTAVNKNWTAKCASATTALQVTALYVSRI